MYRFGGSFLRYGDLVTHFYQRCGGSFTDVDGSRYSIKDVGVHLYMWWFTASETWVAHYGHIRDSFQDEVAHLKIRWLTWRSIGSLGDFFGDIVTYCKNV